MFEVVLTKLHVDNTTSLLDVGCGTGMFAMLARVRGAAVSGLDASPISIEIARERTPTGDFAVGEMEELPYPDQMFEAVTGFNAFQKALGALMPPAPAGSPAPLALSQQGVVEDLLVRAGLSLTASGEVDCPVDYPDKEVMLKAFCSAGPVMRAIRHVGERQVYEVVSRSMAPYQRRDGSYRQENKFRYFITSV